MSHAGTAGDIGHLTVMTQWPEASRTFGFSDVSQGGLESCLVVAVTILVDVAPQEPHLYAREVRKRFHKGCQGALVRALPPGRAFALLRGVAHPLPIWGPTGTLDGVSVRGWLAIAGRATSSVAARNGPRAALRLEVHAEEELGDDERGDGHVDGEAEWRPPPRAPDELGAMLPEVLGAVGKVQADDEPGRDGDGGR